MIPEPIYLWMDCNKTNSKDKNEQKQFLYMICAGFSSKYSEIIDRRD